MILSRIIHHLKTQNWTAVALEFVIVVAGVVIGFQVTAWNGEQTARADEARLLSQLYDDVQGEIERKQSWIDDLIQKNARLVTAIELIQNPEGGEIMTEDQCNAAWESHIIIPYPSQLPTLDEIMAIGGLSSLRDTRLRSALLTYRSQMEEMRELQVAIRNDLTTIVDDFADEMPRRLDRASNSIGADCQLDLMRDSQVLQNRLISNYGRAGGLLEHARRELALLVSVMTHLPSETTP